MGWGHPQLARGDAAGIHPDNVIPSTFLGVGTYQIQPEQETNVTFEFIYGGSFGNHPVLVRFLALLDEHLLVDAIENTPGAFYNQLVEPGELVTPTFRIPSLSEETHDLTIIALIGIDQERDDDLWGVSQRATLIAGDSLPFTPEYIEFEQDVQIMGILDPAMGSGA